MHKKEEKKGRDGVSDWNAGGVVRWECLVNWNLRFQAVFKRKFRFSQKISFLRFVLNKSDYSQTTKLIIHRDWWCQKLEMEIKGIFRLEQYKGKKMTSCNF